MSSNKGKQQLSSKQKYQKYLLFLMIIVTISSVILMRPLNTKSRYSANSIKQLLFNKLNIQADLTQDEPEEGQNELKYDQHIITPSENLWWGFTMSGFIFDDMGMKKQIYEDVVTTRAHSFSPYIENESKKRFIDPPPGNKYFANSPAIIFDKDKIVLVARIWLAKESIKYRKVKPRNSFADNYFYTQVFDKNLQPITNGKIMGMPAPKQFTIGDGPIEPRLFKYNGKIYCSFNIGLSLTPRTGGDPTVIWDMEKSVAIFPELLNGRPMQSSPTEFFHDKHWMAFESKKLLYFVYSFDPLRILRCTSKLRCDFLPMPTAPKYRKVFFVSSLRGGTPFEKYEGDYYISIAHTTMHMPNGRYYTAHLVVMCMRDFRFVYVSDDIDLNPHAYYQAPMVRGFKDGFFFPVSLVIEDKDTIVIGGHVNDFSSVLIRMRGMERLMRKIIDLDNNTNPKLGPPLWSVEDTVLWMMQNMTSKVFTQPKKPSTE